MPRSDIGSSAAPTAARYRRVFRSELLGRSRKCPRPCDRQKRFERGHSVGCCLNNAKTQELRFQPVEAGDPQTSVVVYLADPVLRTEMFAKRSNIPLFTSGRWS
jgi:hypothetical protein